MGCKSAIFNQDYFLFTTNMANMLPEYEHVINNSWMASVEYGIYSENEHYNLKLMDYF